MNVGSLFSGIGGFDYGLERAGMRVAWQCEADPFCRRVLARHWPGTTCHADVRELHGANVESVEVLCGGFPCQDISAAGKGAGIDGQRSGLWAEFARLIGELRPRYVVVENVSALLGRGLGRVLGDLAESGYDAEWDCLPAAAFGAPHQRDRVWIVAYPSSVGGQDRPRLFTGSPLVGAIAGANGGDQHGNPAARTRLMGSGESKRSGRSEEMADAEGKPIRAGLRESEPGGLGRGRSGDGCGAGEFQDADERAVQPWRIGGRAAQAGGSEWWAVEPPVGRVAHGVPDRLAQLAALGNALVPQIAEWLGSQILEYERRAA